MIGQKPIQGSVLEQLEGPNDSPEAIFWVAGLNRCNCPRLNAQLFWFLLKLVLALAPVLLCSCSVGWWLGVGRARRLVLFLAAFFSASVRVHLDFPFSIFDVFIGFWAPVAVPFFSFPKFGSVLSGSAPAARPPHDLPPPPAPPAPRPPPPPFTSSSISTCSNQPFVGHSNPTIPHRRDRRPFRTLRGARLFGFSFSLFPLPLLHLLLLLLHHLPSPLLPLVPCGSSVVILFPRLLFSSSPLPASWLVPNGRCQRGSPAPALAAVTTAVVVQFGLAPPRRYAGAAIDRAGAVARPRRPALV